MITQILFFVALIIMAFIIRHWWLSHRKKEAGTKAGKHKW